jgi:hypothetical protein
MPPCPPLLLDVPALARAGAQQHTYRQHFSFMHWLCSKQNCLLCAYEHDFGGNYIIPIVLFRQVLQQKNL